MSLFPLNGWGSPIISYLILPTLTLGIAGAAWYARLARTTMIDVLASPYVQMARAKGMPERTILSGTACATCSPPW